MSDEREEATKPPGDNNVDAVHTAMTDAIGNWETESLAHFFVPLPEPIAVPDGYVHAATFEQPLDVHRWLNDPHHSHAEPPFVPPLHSVMLRFHQVPVSARALTDDFNFLVDIARNVLPEGAVPVRPPVSSNTSVPGSLITTVVELVVPADASDGPTLSERFDFGIEVIRQVQRAYATQINHWTMLVTRELLPVAIPLAVRESDGGWQLSIFTVNESAIRRAVPPGPTLDPEQMSSIANTATSLARGHPFALHLDLRREALVNLWRLGNTRATVVFANSSGEVLLDSLLAQLLWEEGADPEDSATSIFHRVWLPKRLRTHYHGRIQGSWNTGPVQDWLSDCAALRHRVVHGGYEPDHSTARRALEVTDALINFIVERMRDPRVVEQYPRTVIAVRGPRATNGHHGARLAALLHSPTEPSWLDLFTRWKFFLDARLRDLAGLPRPAPARAITSVLVAEANGDFEWYAHDPDNRLVRRSTAPEGVSATELLETLPPAPPGERTSVAHWAQPGQPLEPLWTAEYKVLPGREVTLGYPSRLP